MSFDLGLHGDYVEMYAWLDRQEARECGDGLATFVSKKGRDEIAKELAEVVDPKGHARIYLIDREKGGKFFFGRRKVAPWTGYAQTAVPSGEER